MTTGKHESDRLGIAAVILHLYNEPHVDSSSVLLVSDSIK
jgi:hypothetical protein